MQIFRKWFYGDGQEKTKKKETPRASRKKVTLLDVSYVFFIWLRTNREGEMDVKKEALRHRKREVEEKKQPTMYIQHTIQHTYVPLRCTLKAKHNFPLCINLGFMAGHFRTEQP